MNFLIVGAGGFLGAASRYGAGLLITKLGIVSIFPISTLMVNFLGSFFIGMAAEFFIKNQGMGSPIQLFIMTGILGGFTTFSAFSLEVVNLISNEKWFMAFLYITISVISCLVGVYFGKNIIH